ncbi:organic solute transporter Ostalpha-domain-containing protein [Radiomyces spectabilis]|uniref:organic solute transporter Ostalpha-domain-containing protein n=1 Tax=Radiomyces spectabilis TaxID=64574 RepID=UPI00221EAFD8|nr:organic solute transporter Ostalpha-domain-containing protein [Radiomyces spectabilis]KAI8376087.1 organic solute transporter Ostalpha-domain-containing protein [Radiomyces spectabilis]
MDNSTISEGAGDSCPTTGGLRNDGGFSQPGFHFKDLLSHPSQNWHVLGWLACLVLLLITWIVALYIVWKHLRNYYDPEIQRHKLRVLLYPPVYATLAWFSYLRYDYSTTIMFFATLFEAFAVYNLYACLQAYLKPFREEAGTIKEGVTTKVFMLFKVNLKSKWGMHYRIITDILVFQYPIWSIIDALVSVIASVKGYYCGESYNFHGAHVYLVIINFISLSIILSALFTYLAIFHEEWQRGHIKAHGMFWCVKGPIMVIFYFGEILLSVLETAHIIKGTDGTHSSDGLAWPAAAVKNGLYVILICACMCVIMFVMIKFFGPDDNINKALNQEGRLSTWQAFVDGYLSYLPEFFYNVLCCGVDSYRLARKRMELKARKKREMYATSETTGHLLSPMAQGPIEETKVEIYPPESEVYPMPKPAHQSSHYHQL